MKKVLVLTYYFPPSTLTASNRIYSWARYLHECGIYPVIVTRKWDTPLLKAEDAYKPSENGIVHEINKDFEVYYLPYKPNLRDRLHTRSPGKYLLLRKTLTFLEITSQFFSNAFLPYRNIYDHARQLLKNDKEFSMILTSGNPFILFKFAYLLHKEFKIKWMADYRDEWTTNDVEEEHSFSSSALQKAYTGMAAHFEKKWVKTASGITSVTDAFTRRISSFTGVAGKTIYNGFLEEDFPKSSIKKNNEFSIAYSGSLYYSQPVEVFLKGYQRFLENHKGEAIQLIFIGMNFDEPQKNRVLNYLKKSEQVVFTDRLSRQESIDQQIKSHLLLLVPITEVNGWLSSKVYEYIASGTSIMLCPSDNGPLAETLSRLPQAMICRNENEVETSLEEVYSRFLRNEISTYEPAKTDITFSRRKQALELGKYINALSDE